jgi:methanogenic corrinoid protein MtbC1
METLEAELPGSALRAVETVRESLAVFDREPKPIERLSASDAHGRLALEFVERVLSGRRRRAIQGLVDAVESGRCTLEDAYIRVLLPAQTEIGNMWHLGEITVSEEHAATDTTRSAMAVLSHRVPPPPDDAPCVITAAVEGNRHDIAVRCAADFVEMAGMRSASLGADVPADDLVHALKAFESSTVVLSVALTTHLDALARTVSAIRRSQNGQRVRVIVGGRIFDEAPDLAVKIGADAHASDPRDVPHLVSAT